MNSPEDYCPPGLGKTCEDLITKHAGKVSAGETPYQWAVRTAAETRALIAKVAPMDSMPAITEPPKDATGKTAYDWARENGKSTVEAARFCGVSEYSIKAHRRYYNLPLLVDGRVNSDERKRFRRSPEVIIDVCRQAYAELKRTGATQTSICRKHKLDSKTFKNFILTKTRK